VVGVLDLAEGGGPVVGGLHAGLADSAVVSGVRAFDDAHYEPLRYVVFDKLELVFGAVERWGQRRTVAQGLLHGGSGDIQALPGLIGGGRTRGDVIQIGRGRQFGGAVTVADDDGGIAGDDAAAVLGAVAEAGGGLAVKKHRGRAFGNGVHGAADAQGLVALAGGGFSADENIRRAVEDGAAHMGLGTGFDLGADVMVADGCGKFGHGVVSFGSLMACGVQGLTVRNRREKNLSLNKLA